MTIRSNENTVVTAVVVVVVVVVVLCGVVGRSRVNARSDAQNSLAARPFATVSVSTRPCAISLLQTARSQQSVPSRPLTNTELHAVN